MKSEKKITVFSKEALTKFKLTCIDNTLESLQKFVGGYIKVLSYPLENQKIVKMDLNSYMNEFGSLYNSGDLFDYPLEEIPYIIRDTDITILALIENRLYQIQ